MLQRVAVCCSVLQCVAVAKNCIMQFIAVRCSVLQRVAVCCSSEDPYDPQCHSVSQLIAVVLRCVAGTALQ